MAVNRREPQARPSGRGDGLSTCALKARCPTLAEFLESTTFGDGSPRIVPTLTLFLEQGVLKACLNDREEGMIAFISAGSLTGLLEALEEALILDTLDWRPSVTRAKKKN